MRSGSTALEVSTLDDRYSQQHQVMPSRKPRKTSQVINPHSSVQLFQANSKLAAAGNQDGRLSPEEISLPDAIQVNNFN